MAKLVDVPDLGSGAARRGGSSPSARTKKNPLNLAWLGGFLGYVLAIYLWVWHLALPKAFFQKFRNLFKAKADGLSLEAEKSK